MEKSTCSWTLLAMCVWMTGCATGATSAPMGGRMTFEAMRYRPATPASMPRAVPPEVDSPKPTAVAKAPAPKKDSRSVARPAVASQNTREKVLATARALVGQSRVKVGGRTYPSDCTGFVEAAYAAAGVSLRGSAKPGDNGVTAFYRHAQAHGRVYTGGRPVPGDLVFFRETYDQNRDGRRNDGLTHVGIVDKVDANGTVTVIHRVKRGVVRYRMNLARPKLAKDPRTGQVLNDTLRAPGPGRSFALTGQLFSAYATVLPSTPTPPSTVARR